MNVEEARVFLEELKGLSAREKNYLEQIEKLETMMTSITQKLNPNPTSSHDNESKIEKMMINKINLEHELLEYAYHLDVHRMQAMNVMWKLPKVQGDILRDRYVFDKPYEDIARYLGYSIRQISRHKKKALQNFADVYSEVYE